MFEQFIKERVYLKGVSNRTVEWYKESFKWLGNESPSENDLKTFVMKMREKGLTAASCNNRIRSVNAYLHWQKMGNTKCGSGCSHLRVPKLKEELKPVAVYSSADIGKILRFKPSEKQRRTFTLLLLIFDVGLRVSECISLRVNELDFDNLLISVKGKGNKHRIVPMSQELRKLLWKFCGGEGSRFVFCTHDGKPLMRRNVLRDVKKLCKKIGVAAPKRTVHAARHTMATDYIRKGGNVVKLQRILGHSSVSTTMRYIHLVGADLVEEHSAISILSRR